MDKATPQLNSHREMLAPGLIVKAHVGSRTSLPPHWGWGHQHGCCRNALCGTWDKAVMSTDMAVCYPADSTHTPCFRLWAILIRAFCCHCVLDPVVTAACQAYIHFLNQTWSGVCMTSRSSDVELQSDKCSACRGNSLLSRTSNTRPLWMKNAGLRWVTDPFP